MEIEELKTRIYRLKVGGGGREERKKERKCAFACVGVGMCVACPSAPWVLDIGT